MNRESLNQEDREEAIRDAKIRQRRCELLIKQCEQWLPEEEGLKNLAKKHKEESGKKSLLKLLFTGLFLLSEFGLFTPIFGQTTRKHDFDRNYIDSLYHHSRDVELLDKAAEKTTKDKDIPSAIKFYIKAGKLCRESNNFLQAIHYHNNGLELANQSADTLEIIQCLNQIGTNYRRMGALEDASTFHYRALAFCEQYSDKLSDNARKNKVISLNSIGNVYLSLNNHAAAESAFREALAGEIVLNSHLGMAINYANIGAIFENKQMYDSARVYYEHSMKYNQLARSNLGISLCNTHLGRLEEIAGNYEKALNRYMEAYAIMEKSDDRWHWLEACLAIVRVYIEKKDMNAASVYLKRAEESAQKIRSKESFALVYKMKYHFYEKSGNAGKALENYIMSRNYEDSILNINNINHISNLRLHYETELRETTIEKQRIEIEQKNTVRNVLILSTLIAVVILILLWYMLRLRNRRNRTLAEMNVTKDKFFSIISHDLQNPTIAQRNALQALIDHADKMDTEALKQYYAELLKSTDSQIGLLYDLLNWAKLQSGRMTFNPQQFNLKALVDETVNVLKTHIAGKHISLNIDYPDKQVMICADRTMLAIILRNLLTNAVKFTPEGGKIRLNVVKRCVETERAPSPQGIQISVEDNGIGMNEETLRNLFRLDNQKSRTGTAGEQGSGLGLIVCKELVEKTGGKMTVESEAGKGSKITIEI